MDNNFTVSKQVFNKDILKIGMPIRIKCNYHAGNMYAGVYNCFITKVSPLEMNVIYVEDFEGRIYTQIINIDDINIKKFELLGKLDLVIKESGGTKSESKSKKDNTKKNLFD